MFTFTFHLTADDTLHGCPEGYKKLALKYSNYWGFAQLSAGPSVGVVHFGGHDNKHRGFDGAVEGSHSLKHVLLTLDAPYIATYAHGITVQVRFTPSEHKVEVVITMPTNVA